MINNLIIPVIAALVGAGIMAYQFTRLGRSPVIGGALGAGGGALGSLLFMLPLNFCSFAPETAPGDVLAGVLLILLGMAIVLYPLSWVAGRVAHGGISAVFATQGQTGAFKGRVTPWLLLAPTLAVLVIFLYTPFVNTFRLSTLLASRNRERFICLENFTGLLADGDYLNSVVITFVFATAIIIIGLGLALFIAMMAYQPLKGARIYRTLLVWPYALSPVVAGVIFRLIFTSPGGVANGISENLFGVRIPWLSDPTITPMVVIMTAVWNHLGFNILFYIAGLQNVPTDLQEAGAIDGANAWQRFRHIIFPLLSPITFFLIVTNLTYSFFDIFGTIDYLTAGGPNNATSVMIYNIFETQSQNAGLGKAAAQSIVLFVLVVGLTILQFRTSGRRVNYGA